MKNLWRNLYVTSRIKLFSMFGVVAESFLRCPGPIPPRFGRTAWGTEVPARDQKAKEKGRKAGALSAELHTKENGWAEATEL